MIAVIFWISSKCATVIPNRTKEPPDVLASKCKDYKNGGETKDTL